MIFLGPTTTKIICRQKMLKLDFKQKMLKLDLSKILKNKFYVFFNFRNPRITCTKGFHSIVKNSDFYHFWYYDQDHDNY